MRSLGVARAWFELYLYVLQRQPEVSRPFPINFSHWKITDQVTFEVAVQQSWCVRPTLQGVQRQYVLSVSLICSITTYNQLHMAFRGHVHVNTNTQIEKHGSQRLYAPLRHHILISFSVDLDLERKRKKPTLNDLRSSISSELAILI